PIWTCEEVSDRSRLPERAGSETSSQVQPVRNGAHRISRPGLVSEHGGGVRDRSLPEATAPAHAESRAQHGAHQDHQGWPPQHRHRYSALWERRHGNGRTRDSPPPLSRAALHSCSSRGTKSHSARSHNTQDHGANAVRSFRTVHTQTVRAMNLKFKLRGQDIILAIMLGVLIFLAHNAREKGLIGALTALQLIEGRIPVAEARWGRPLLAGLQLAIIWVLIG